MSSNEVNMSTGKEVEDAETTVEIKIKTLDSQTYTLRVNKCVSDFYCFKLLVSITSKMRIFLIVWQYDILCQTSGTLTIKVYEIVIEIGISYNCYLSVVQWDVSILLVHI